MKVAAIIVRSLMGLGFVVFGSNYFFHFLHMPPMSGPPADFFNAVAMESKYMAVVAAFQVLGGLLTLSGRFTPLGLVVLGPILVNVLIFHLTLTGGAGIMNGVVFSVMELFLIWAYSANFKGIFAAPIVS